MARLTLLAALILGCTGAPEPFYPSEWRIVVDAPTLEQIETTLGHPSIALLYLSDVAESVDRKFDGVLSVRFGGDALEVEGKAIIHEDPSQPHTGFGWDGSGTAMIYDAALSLRLVLEQDPNPPWSRLVEITAAVVAHEIGHALGLAHVPDLKTRPCTDPVMSPILNLLPCVEHRFSAGELAAIASRLNR